MYGKKSDVNKTPMGKAMGKAKKMLIIVGDEDRDPVTGAGPAVQKMGRKKITKTKMPMDKVKKDKS
jgi:hypothetical protein